MLSCPWPACCLERNTVDVSYQSTPGYAGCRKGMLFRTVSKERLHERGAVNLIFRARRDIRGIRHIYFTAKQPCHIKDNGPGRSQSEWVDKTRTRGPRSQGWPPLKDVVVGSCSGTSSQYADYRPPPIYWLKH